MLNKIHMNIFIILFFVLVFLLFGILGSGFFTWNNLITIMMRATILAPIAFGVMLSLIVKGIDLSSGSVIGLLGIILSMMISRGFSLWIGVIVLLAGGAIIGFINGILIGKFNINPFIATLSIMFIGNSIERILTQGGLPIYLYGDSSGLSHIFRGAWVGVPIPVILLSVLAVLLFIVLNLSIFGRRLYAVGSSIEGAINAGVPVRLFYTAVYTISGVLMSFSALLVASQVQSGQPLVGQSFLWDSIGAAFLGTIFTRNPRPNILGTLLGVLFLAMITNGLTILGLEFYWLDFFRGLIILFILLVSAVNIRFRRWSSL